MAIRTGEDLAVRTAEDLDKPKRSAFVVAPPARFERTAFRAGAVALTWDCVVIDEKSIEQNDASIYVNKELQRVFKNSLQKLNDKDIIKGFPAVLTSNSTALVLKKTKTITSVRKIWLPTTVARMLVEWRAQQEERKEFLDDEYTDYDLVLSLPNGRPLEGQVISVRSRTSSVRTASPMLFSIRCVTQARPTS